MYLVIKAACTLVAALAIIVGVQAAKTAIFGPGA